jgi:hypothetical protein
MTERSLLRPFGPTIAKVSMGKDLVEKLNTYIDDTIKNTNKTKELNHGPKLAGNVQQEFKLEVDFIKSSGWLSFLSNESKNWIEAASGKKITKFDLIETWVVRQFENDYNPLHVHGGHISGVGYLKVPSSYGKYSQDGKAENQNGKLSLVHGTRQFMSAATFNIEPKVGDFYFFPNYLMHTVYPFICTNEERRSISFNAYVDQDIYNVYGHSKK